MSQRCTGHCCHRFYLDPGLVERLRAGDKALKDGAFVADMIIPTDEPNLYNCKHLGADDNCTVYESRPQLCADYPYDRPCEREGCTYKP